MGHGALMEGWVFDKHMEPRHMSFDTCNYNEG
jgi:hypothetical protein